MVQVVGSAARARQWAVAIAAALKLGMSSELQKLITDVILNTESLEEELTGIVRDVYDRKGKDDEEDGKSEDDDVGNMDNDETDADLDTDSPKFSEEVKRKAYEKEWKRTGKLIMCCRDWHAVGGTGNASIGASLLNAILTSWTSRELADGLTNLPEGRAVVEALDAHTRRHLDRVNGDRTAILELVLVTMRGGVEVVDKPQNGQQHVNLMNDGGSDDDEEGESRGDQSSESEKPNGNVNGHCENSNMPLRRKRKRREEVDCDY